MWQVFARKVHCATPHARFVSTPCGCDDLGTLQACLKEAEDAQDDLGEAGSSAAPREALHSMVGGHVGLICAEPYYHCCAGRASLSALNFYFQVRALRPLVEARRVESGSSDGAKGGCAVVPRRAVIKAIGVMFDQLGDAYRPLRCGEHVCHLDHTRLDDCWKGCREKPMRFALWQYAHEVVSTEAMEVMALDYEAEVARTGPVHGGGDVGGGSI